LIGKSQFNLEAALFNFPGTVNLLSQYPLLAEDRDSTQPAWRKVVAWRYNISSRQVKDADGSNGWTNMRNIQLVKIVPGNRLHKAAFALLLVTLFSSFASTAATPIIEQKELLQILDAGSPILIIDVRTRAEFQSGHVPQAINIPHFELQGRLAELPQDRSREIVTYCEHGPRAGVAEYILQQAGFTAVRHLQGDMYSWRRNGLPIAYP